MNEIYWLTRIAQFEEILTVVVIILGIGALGLSIGYAIIHSAEIDDDDKRTAADLLKLTKRFIIAFVITGTVLLFTPSKKDLVLIYGLGPTIDYIQNSDKAKQIPDKAVEALLEYLENDKDNKDK